MPEPLTTAELIALVELRKIDALRGRDLTGRLIAELQDTLLLSWDAASKQVIRDAIERLRISGDGLMTEADFKAILGDMHNALGDRFAATVSSRVVDVVDTSYRAGASEVPGVEAALRFGLVDPRALSWLHESGSLYWIRSHYERHVQDKLVELGDRALTQGLSRYDAGQLFRQEMGPIFGGSQSYHELLASDIVTKSQSFGRIDAYQAAGAKYARIMTIADHRRSDLCAFLEGKRIPVEIMVQARDNVMAAGGPEAIKRVKPWMSVEEARQYVRGNEVISPKLGFEPFHGHCRSVTVVDTE